MLDFNEALRNKLDAQVRNYLGRLLTRHQDQEAMAKFFETMRLKPKLLESAWEQKFLLGWLFLIEPYNRCSLCIHERVKGKKQSYRADFVTSARQWFYRLGLQFSMQTELKLDHQLIKKCVIEIDGYETHYFTGQKDLARDLDLQEAGYKTFRFPSSQLRNDDDIESCLTDVRRAIQANLADILETCEFDIKEKGR